jgi:hypothetical protein
VIIGYKSLQSGGVALGIAGGEALIGHVEQHKLIGILRNDNARKLVVVLCHTDNHKPLTFVKSHAIAQCLDRRQ